MLPFDCLNSIVEYCKDHKSILSLLSTNALYYTFRNKIRWNKECVFVGNKVLRVPFYDNIEHIYLTKFSCISVPKNLKKITYKNSVYGKYKITPFDTEQFQTNNINSELKVIIEPKSNVFVVNQLFKTNSITKVKVELNCFDYFIWPSNIHTLTLIGNNRCIIPNDIPSCIKKLKIKKKADNLCVDALINLNQLEYLELEFLNDEVNLNSYILPKTLKTLVLSNVLFDIGSIPEGIEEIIYKSDVTYVIQKNIFPNSMKRISFHHGFMVGDIHSILPPNLEYLYLGKTIPDDIIFDKLPKTLKEMYLTYNDNVYHYTFPLLKN